MIRGSLVAVGGPGASRPATPSPAPPPPPPPPRPPSMPAVPGWSWPRRRRAAEPVYPGSARQRRAGREVRRAAPAVDLLTEALDDHRPRVAAHSHLAFGVLVGPAAMREVHDGAAVLGGLELPDDRGADPVRESADRRPLHASAGLERVDPNLERLCPVGTEAEARDRAGLLGHLELVGPVAGEALLGRERGIDLLGVGVDRLAEVDGRHAALLSVVDDPGIRPRR